MAETGLPRSNLGAAALIERRDAIPPVELEIEDGAEVEVQDRSLIQTPDLNIELEEDGGVVIDFDPSAVVGEEGFYENLAETVDDRVLSAISSTLMGGRQGFVGHFFDADGRIRKQQERTQGLGGSLHYRIGASWLQV